MAFIVEKRKWLENYIELNYRTAYWTVLLLGCIMMFLIYWVSSQFVNSSIVRAIVGSIALVIAVACVPLMSGNMSRFVIGASDITQKILVGMVLGGCIIEAVLFYMQPMETVGALLGIIFVFFSVVGLLFYRLIGEI